MSGPIVNTNPNGSVHSRIAYQECDCASCSAVRTNQPNALKRTKALSLMAENLQYSTDLTAAARVESLTVLVADMAREMFRMAARMDGM